MKSNIDLNKVLAKAKLYQTIENKIPRTYLEQYNSAFEVDYAHNSTAIEGNTLSLIETKLLLEDKISIGGKELREIYEVVNHQKEPDATRHTGYIILKTHVANFPGIFVAFADSSVFGKNQKSGGPAVNR